MAKIYYSYDPETFEYIGQGNAQLDPLETKNQGNDVYLLPRYATFISPSQIPSENEVNVWNESTQQWEIKPDFRGTKVYEIDANNFYTGNVIVIETIGETIDGRPTIEPPSNLVKPKWDGTQWVEGETLDNLKLSKINEVKQNASNVLSQTDWKVIRHRDQLALGITTSLTDTEYQNLLSYRQSVRDWSNNKETEINNATTIDELNAIVLDDYPTQ